MTNTPISDSTILHFCRFFTLNIPANSTFFKRSHLILQNNFFILWFIIYILFGTDLHMSVTIATILRNPARSALSTCLRC